MTEFIQVRSALCGDAESLTALAMSSKAFWGYSTEFMSACRIELSVSAEKIADPAFTHVVAESEGSIIGFFCIEKLADTEFELDAIFVAPLHIGEGVGRCLIKHAKSIAISMGADFLVIQGDPNAGQFYEAVGAVLVGVRKSGSIAGRDLPLFKLSLVESGSDVA